MGEREYIGGVIVRVSFVAVFPPLAGKIGKIWQKPHTVRFESSWRTKKCNGRRGMRRFTRRRKTLAAFSAIMGRLGKGSQSTTRPIFRVQYRKLVDEYSQQQEQLKFMPALPDYMSYCCCRCGHTQKLKVSFYPRTSNLELSRAARSTSTRCITFIIHLDVYTEWDSRSLDRPLLLFSF